MENFFKIRAEKQEHIIAAAFAVFGRQGYKKASVADIAATAGIAKGMVTYYFGSKKNLYLYLAELGQKTILQKVEQYFDVELTDFFDKIRMGIEIKVAAMREYPALMQFLVSMMSEKDKDVEDDIRGLVDEASAIGNRILMKETDLAKFRDEIDPHLIAKFINWAGNGLVAELQMLNDIEKYDEVAQEFYELLDMMKATLYKEGATHA
ncbi:MAG: TetR/AcrR family transcriptional regulator [Defluviitaleaceae bacterium]|nr:TetR/AcrR family transcriptional regulator [Defluviitaleaceae bacterium]